MPHFTAIALDRLLDPGASKSDDKSGPNSMPIPNLKPPPHTKLERRNSTSAFERKVKRPQISPALYATPKVTPLPDSPSSFPPSPYIINHKRRGPRLLKSSSNNDVSSHRKALDEDNEDFTMNNAETKAANTSDSVSVTSIVPGTAGEEHQNGDCDSDNGSCNGGFGYSNGKHESTGEECGNSDDMDVESSNLGNDLPKLVALTVERDGEVEDFFDPQESMSVTSNTEVEDNSGPECSLKLTTPVGEFFDAWEELSSEGTPQLCPRDLDAELREIRLSLSSEIEKRKQAEETLSNVQSQWQSIRHQLSLAGLTLPADPIIVAEGAQPDLDPAELMGQQVYVARFVADSIGRGMAKAEVEMEMEAHIEAKNFEIARLWDRLHYYESMNQEMTQRNRETVEVARYQRQKRKRRQKWIWSSIATAIALGTAALAWSYLPTGKGSSSTDSSQAPENDKSTN